MDPEENPYQEGKRAGAHPFAIIVGVIVALWFAIWLLVPNPKYKHATVPADPESVSVTTIDAADAALIMFRIGTTIPEMNAMSVIVPPQATHSQIVALLQQFRQARLDNTLTTMLPPTTPGHELGDHAVADIYVFSNKRYGVADAVRVLSRGAHVPGELYPRAIPFEVAMEQVRGHYRIDLHDTGHPDKGSLGFADESGVHSRSYRPIF